MAALPVHALSHEPCGDSQSSVRCLPSPSHGSKQLPPKPWGSTSSPAHFQLMPHRLATSSYKYESRANRYSHSARRKANVPERMCHLGRGGSTRHAVSAYSKARRGGTRCVARTTCEPLSTVSNRPKPSKLAAARLSPDVHEKTSGWRWQEVGANTDPNKQMMQEDGPHRPAEMCPPNERDCDVQREVESKARGQQKACGRRI